VDHHDERAPRDGRQDVGRVVGRDRHYDLHRGRRRGQHPLGTAGDALHGRLADHEGDAAVGDGRGAGGRIRDGVDVDQLAALESGRDVAGLHRQRELHEFAGVLERRAGQELTIPHGASQDAALRTGGRGQVGVSGVVQPDVDGHEVAGGELGAGREVSGHRPHRDGRVGRADDAGAEEDGGQDEEDAQHEPQIQPAGRAHPPRRRAGQHLHRRG
jgi:hypothetical protein